MTKTCKRIFWSKISVSSKQVRMVACGFLNGPIERKNGDLFLNFLGERFTRDQVVQKQAKSYIKKFLIKM